ncbi:HAD family hydrolase [Gimesia sp.]|uniref:HAD family hydrolase n=1 Tax=Gimesia sp. TaxID=2024833 RepID=UPI003A951693
MSITTIKCVLIDLDHTLCSTAEGAAAALTDFADRYGLTDLDVLKAQFREINESLFARYLNRHVSITEFRLRRYEQLLKLPGITSTSQQSLAAEAASFTEIMNRNCVLYEDSLDFLEYLRSRHLKLALLTNGPADGQRTKIESLGIGHFFDQIFISGETGYEKPSPAAFTNALNVLQGRPENTVMIGDSLELDIHPAVNLGIHAIHLDRLEQESNLDPQFQTVASLKILLKDDFIR